MLGSGHPADLPRGERLPFVIAPAVVAHPVGDAGRGEWAAAEHGPARAARSVAVPAHPGPGEDRSTGRVHRVAAGGALDAVQASEKARVWDLPDLSLMMLATGCRIGECLAIE